MRRKIAILCLLAVLVCLCTYAYLVQSEQLAVASRLVRLHVVANSDTEADQAVKLTVRDRILPVVERLCADCQTQAQALAALQKGLPELKQAAAAALEDCGAPSDVRVSLTTEAFPRREYDTFSLPAGRYAALRVRLGRGEGHNWWCVAFPALCLPASSEELVSAASLAGFSEEQTDLLTGESFDVTLKFRVLDWLQALFQ